SEAADAVSDLDVVVIDRGAEARKERRLNNDAGADGVRLFRNQVWVAGGLRHVRDEFAAIKIIVDGIEGKRTARIQIDDARLADVVGPRDPEAYVVDGAVFRAKLPRRNRAAGIAGDANSAVKVQVFCPRHIFGEGNDGF